MTRFKAVFAVAVGALLAQATAQAQWEVEADPIAFRLNGYSAHAGYRVEAFRADIGPFGADIPESLHGTRVGSPARKVSTPNSITSAPVAGSLPGSKPTTTGHATR